MTYLTQVTLDFASAARLGLRDSYRWNRAVWKAFPGHDGEPRKFLTRLDQRREGFRLLIVSSVQPVRPEWCPADEESWKTKAIPETYFSRARYAFQLCANPTKRGGLIASWLAMTPAMSAVAFWPDSRKQAGPKRDL